jgi:hypothetical protein
MRPQPAWTAAGRTNPLLPERVLPFALVEGPSWGPAHQGVASGDAALIIIQPAAVGNRIFGAKAR